MSPSNDRSGVRGLAQKRCKNSDVSIFTGREAKLNRAIIQTLTIKEPASTRELYKKIIYLEDMEETSYSTVNKRVRDLETLGYLKKIDVKDRPGGITNFYVLNSKARLAIFFDSISIEELLSKMDDAMAKILLEDLLKAMSRSACLNKK